MFWTKDEDKIILENYNSDTNISQLLPSRTKASIYNRAYLLGCKRGNKHLKNSELQILLEDTPLSYYWIGFIMADGCFSGRALNTLKVCLSEKDLLHLTSLAVYINTNIRSRVINKSQVVEIGCTDTVINPLIRTKFDFKHCKTYNPPEKLPTNNTDLLTCLLIGIIDGDGCVIKTSTNRHSIRIGCHKSWFNFYTMLNSAIFTEINPIKDYKSMMVYSINRLCNTQLLLQTIKKFKLPVLERKWSKFD